MYNILLDFSSASTTSFLMSRSVDVLLEKSTTPYVSMNTLIVCGISNISPDAWKRGCVSNLKGERSEY